MSKMQNKSVIETISAPRAGAKDARTLRAIGAPSATLAGCDDRSRDFAVKAIFSTMVLKTS